MVAVVSQPSLRTLAIAQAMGMAEDNASQRAALREAMEADPAVWRAIMEPWQDQAVARAIADAVAARRRGQRAHLWHRPAQPDARVEMLARTNGYTILDMRLPNGKRLGDATGEDLAAAVALYRQQSTAAADKAEFFAAIAARVPAGKTVAQSMRATEIERLRPKGGAADAA